MCSNIFILSIYNCVKIQEKILKHYYLNTLQDWLYLNTFTIRLQEEVTNFLKFSKCDLEKVFFDAEVYPKFSAGFTIYDTYNTVSFIRSKFCKKKKLFELFITLKTVQVCTTNDLCSWCIPSTTDYFGKVRSLITFLDTRSVLNTRQCPSMI